MLVKQKSEWKRALTRSGNTNTQIYELTRLDLKKTRTKEREKQLRESKIET